MSSQTKCTMTEKIAYVLSTCNTCQRILQEVNWTGKIQDVKVNNIDEATLDKIAQEHGGYENVFSRRAMKYRSMGLKEMNLTEEDYKKYILEEYTFLKRPVFIVGNQSFAGNTKKNVQALIEVLERTER